MRALEALVVFLMLGNFVKFQLLIGRISPVALVTLETTGIDSPRLHSRNVIQLVQKSLLLGFN